MLIFETERIGGLVYYNFTIMAKRLTIFGVFFITFFLGACSNDEVSKEDEVRQFIESGVLAAESRSHKDLAALIDKSYKDDKKQDKNRLMSLVQTYFYMHKNIHLFVKIDEIVFQGENGAFVSMYVAMAGSVISDASMLSSLRAKTYKFELQLIKEDEWLVSQAKWGKSSLKDMIKLKHAQMGDQ